MKMFRHIKSNRNYLLLIVVLFFGMLLAVYVVTAHMLNSATFEAESGARSGAATTDTDNSASNQAFLRFGQYDGFDPQQTLPPGSQLPSDEVCKSRVKPSIEIRPQNAQYNAVAGSQKNLSGPYKNRITGNFTGTTDEILQWVACKWGIDVDIVRAQAAKESYWIQSSKGDWTTDVSVCPPNHGLGVDGRPGECPESYGILQVRYLYHGPPAGLQTWPEAETSTAYNADYTYSVWRECYEGGYGWLNTVERGATYAAGDAWGCTGVWFSGRWYTDPAKTYIQDVQNYYATKIWQDPGFINYR